MTESARHSAFQRVFANLSLRAKGIVVVSIPLAALLATTIVALFTLRQDQVAQSEVRHTYDVRDQINSLLTLLVDAETGVRGYALTQRSEFLDPYREAVQRLAGTQAGLQSLAQDDPAQVRRILTIRQLAQRRLEALENLKTQADASHPTRQSLTPHLLRGKSLMDAMRKELAAMDAEEDRLLIARTQRAVQSTRLIRGSILIGLLAGLLGGVLAILIFTNEISVRAERLSSQAGLLAQGLPLALQPFGTDEIGRLETAVVQAAHLQAAHNENLHAELALRREAEGALLEKTKLAALAADVAVAITRANPLPQTLQQCAEAFVQHLEAAFARIWTLSSEDNVLELQASAGMYTHLDGAHSKVPVGRFKIGHIAQERRPHLTNTVAGDPLVGDQEWARREGMVAFAGYPLLVEDRVVGVLAMFARQPLSEASMAAIGSVANGITLFIDRARNLDALHSAKDEAERANKAKSEFISRMSHELRTPLNSILGFAQILEMEQPSPAQQESIKQILQGGRHLLVLINELLDISRIESGNLTLSQEPVAVHAALQEVCELVRPLAARDQVEILWEKSPPDHFHVTADRLRLKQVLLNLVSNAVKYSGAGARVTVSTTAKEGRLRLEVKDTGPGIAPEKIARLFNLFDRLGAEETAVEGTGLGLVLARKLTELMGGQIGVHSRVGEGSAFWIEFPQVLSPLQQTGVTEGEAPAGEGASALAPRHKLLYIEDSPSNVQLMERILRHRPQVLLLTAGDGRLGLQMAHSHRPDLILLDVHLPKMGGEQVLRELCNHPATRSIPVIVVSADATPGQVQRLLQAGARSYLTKPLDIAEFLAALDRTLPPELSQE